MSVSLPASPHLRIGVRDEQSLEIDGRAVLGGQKKAKVRGALQQAAKARR